MKIYVGNLSYATTEDGLRAKFQEHGTVDEVTIVVDRFTGRSRGFAFVSMPNSAEANAAIAAINGQEIDGRAVSVNEARSKKPEGGGRSGESGGGGGFRRRRDFD
jgi:cold-inducible RNA-binding protein